jgi:transposase InsO family protein
MNIVSNPNIVWVMDITQITPIPGNTIYIFFCLDIYSNYVVSYLVSQRPFTSSQIIRTLKVHLEFNSKLGSPILVHSDRGTQFSSKAYNQFVLDYKDYFTPSMSPANNPKSNPVIERFIRTFKEHKIENQTILESLLQEYQKNPNFNRPKIVVNKYVSSLNDKPNKKAKTGPFISIESSKVSSQLMEPPKYTKAYSSHYGLDIRRNFIQDYRQQSEIISNDLISYYYKTSNTTLPIEISNEETKKVLQFFYKTLVQLIKISSDKTKSELDDGFANVQDKLAIVNQKLDQLLKKKERPKTTLPLREPIYEDDYFIFMRYAGLSRKKRQADLVRSQLRIVYTICFNIGCRVNELRFLTLEQINILTQTGKITLIHYKTKTTQVHVISKTGQTQLQQLGEELYIVFEKYNYKYLFGKNEPIHPKSIIRLVNKDLLATSKTLNNPLNVKSHSFRVGLITALLKKTSLIKTAQIVGHKSVLSTEKYNRYTPEFEEIQQLLKDALHNSK